MTGEDGCLLGSGQSWEGQSSHARAQFAFVVDLSRGKGCLPKLMANA